MELKKRSPAEHTRRWLAMLAGVTLISFGVVFTLKAALGTTAVNSLPFALSCILDHLTIGNCIILLNVLFVLIQILVLRRDFHPIQLLQLVISFVNGYITDFAKWLMEGMVPANYVLQWIFCLVGLLFVGTGVTLEVIANEVPTATEGLAVMLSKVTGMKFGNGKITVDCTLVSLALVLSYLFLDKTHSIPQLLLSLVKDNYYGIGLGTLAAALLVGQIVKLELRFASPMFRLMETGHFRQ